MDAQVHRIPETAAGDMDLLSQFQKHHCHARILTDRYALLPGQKKVVLNILKDPLPYRAFLLLPGRMNGTAQVVRKHRGRLDTQPLHQFPDVSA